MLKPYLCVKLEKALLACICVLKGQIEMKQQVFQFLLCSLGSCYAEITIRWYGNGHSFSLMIFNDLLLSTFNSMKLLPFDVCPFPV